MNRYTVYILRRTGQRFYLTIVTADTIWDAERKASKVYGYLPFGESYIVEES